MSINKTILLNTLALMLLISAIYLVFTFPVSFNMGSYIYDSNDIGIMYWNTINFRKSISTDTHLLFTNWQIYPIGTSIIQHTYTPLLNVFSLFFQNKTLALNLYVFLQFLLTGTGTYILIIFLSKNQAAAVFGSILMTFSNYMMIRIAGHTNLVSLGLIPFYFLYYFKAFHFSKEGLMFKRKFLVWLIILLIGNVFIDLVIGFMVILASFLFIFSHYLTILLSKYSKWRIVVGLLILLILADQGTQLLRREFNDVGGLWYSADLVYYFLPLGSKIYQSDFLSELIHKYCTKGTVESAVFLGFSTWLLFGISVTLYMKRNNKTHFQNVILIMILLSFCVCSPALTLFGKRIIYTPNAIMHFLPLANNFRCPARFSIFLNFLIPVFIGFVFKQEYSKKSIFYIFSISIMLLIIELIPLKRNVFNTSEIPKYYFYLGEKEGEGLLSIPFSIQDGMRFFGDDFDKEALLFQEIHNKKIIGGYLARLSPSVFDIHMKNPVLNEIVNLQNDIPPSILNNNDIKDFLTLYHPKYILITPSYATTNLLSFFRVNFQEMIKEESYIDGAYIFSLK